MVRILVKALKTFTLAAFLLLPASQAFPQATFNQYLSAANKKYNAADYEAALKYYKAAAKLNPNSASVHQGMGNCYYGLGQKRDALRSYDKALELDPNNEKLEKFADKIRQAEGGGEDFPTLEPASTGSDQLGLPSDSTAEEDSKKYNKWTSGRNYTKNILEITLGPVFTQGGTTGFGLGTGYYFPATKSLFLGIVQNMFIFSGDYYDPYYLSYESFTEFDFETLLLVKYVFEGKAVRPMIFAGGGLDMVMVMYSGYYSMDYDFYPEVVVGGGVSFPLGNDVSLFVQGRTVIQFVPGGTFTMFPVEFGFSFPVN